MATIKMRWEEMVGQEKNSMVQSTVRSPRRISRREPIGPAGQRTSSMQPSLAFVVVDIA